MTNPLMKEYKKYRLTSDYGHEMMEINEELMKVEADEQPETLTNLHSKSVVFKPEYMNLLKKLWSTVRKVLLPKKSCCR